MSLIEIVHTHVHIIYEQYFTLKIFFFSPRVSSTFSSSLVSDTLTSLSFLIVFLIFPCSIDGSRLHRTNPTYHPDI